MENTLERGNAILGTDYRTWRELSRHNGLTEEFIREFKNDVDWSRISKYQNLSEDFIREFKDRVDWDWIAKYQRLSKNFIREFKDDIYMGLIADSWQYKSVEEKKKAVMDTGLYECHEDYFIAYKGIRTEIGIQDITFSISTLKVRLMKRGAIVLPRSAVSVSPLGRRKGQGITAMNLW